MQNSFDMEQLTEEESPIFFSRRNGKNAKLYSTLNSLQKKLVSFCNLIFGLSINVYS
jgi:hypothetical protein